MCTRVTHRHSLNADYSKKKKKNNYWPKPCPQCFQLRLSPFPYANLGFGWGGPWVRRGKEVCNIFTPSTLTLRVGLYTKWETFHPWCGGVLKETEWGEKHLVSRRCSSVCRWAVCASACSVQDRLTFTFYCFGLHAVGPLNLLRFSPPPYL